MATHTRSRGRVGIPGVLALTVMGLGFGPSGRARAELLVGLTVQNALITFDSDTPGTISSAVAISGLTAGDTLVGIDRRPQIGPNNGLIYGVGVASSGSARVYTLNATTGAASLVSTLAADPADVTPPTPFTTVLGTSFGIDFNPVPDRLRLVSNTGQNLRINVDNGLTQLDGPLAYQSGDPNFGTTPVDIAVAYSNNFGGATATVLRGVDIAKDPDLLVIHTDPNAGTLQTSLTLPFNSSVVTAYDISGLSGVPYFAVTPAGSLSTSLFAAGPGGVTLVGTIGGGVSILGLAAPVGSPIIPEPSSWALMAMGTLGLVGYARRRAR